MPESRREALVDPRNALLVLDNRLDCVNRIRGLDVQSDGLAVRQLDEDLHITVALLHNFISLKMGYYLWAYGITVGLAA